MQGEEIFNFIFLSPLLPLSALVLSPQPSTFYDSKMAARCDCFFLNLIFQLSTLFKNLFIYLTNLNIYFLLFNFNLLVDLIYNFESIHFYVINMFFDFFIYIIFQSAATIPRFRNNPGSWCTLVNTERTDGEDTDGSSSFKGLQMERNELGNWKIFFRNKILFGNDFNRIPWFAKRSKLLVI